MAALGPCCCVLALSTCGERGLLFVVVHGLLTEVASPVAEHGLQTHRPQSLWLAGSRVPAQQLWCTGPAAPWHMGSSTTRARTHVPCTGRWTPNNRATREALYSNFSFSLLYAFCTTLKWLSYLSSLTSILWFLSHFAYLYPCFYAVEDSFDICFPGIILPSSSDINWFFFGGWLALGISMT